MQFLFGQYTSTFLRFVGYVSVFLAVAPIAYCLCFERKPYSIGIALACLLLSGMNAIFAFGFADSEP